tara:strand:+ start:3799 stop:4944 length:1146 start_codon:yes stop_codon:yes gene_type:complete
MNILFLDREGGHGGSSRSLFYLIRFIKKNNFEYNIKVYNRKRSILDEKLKQLGVETYFCPKLPVFSPVDKFLNNLILLVKFSIDWIFSYNERKKLLDEINKKFDLVYINHESFFWLTRWLKKNTKKKIISHIRTCPPKSYFSSLQLKTIYEYSNKLVFITENEKLHMEKFLNKKIEGDIIYNIFDERNLLFKKNINPNKIIFLSVSNFSLERGQDRIIQVIEELKRKNIKGIKFVFIGDTKIKKIMKKNKIFNLVHYANQKKVNDLIEFKGHLEQIDHFFKEGTILVKLSRLDLSWGRDVIEAMSFGCPVISTGFYDKFVKSNQTGLLLGEFHLSQTVDEILKLVSNQEKLKELSENAQITVKNICMSEENLNKILKIFRI